MTNTSDTPAQATHPLTILIVGDTFTPDVNGAAKFTEKLASGMAGRGHDVHVLVPAGSKRHGTWTERYDGQEITAHRARSYRWYPHDWLRFVPPWRTFAVARRTLSEVQPDVLHFQSVVILGRGATVEANKRGIRIIGTNHLMLENIMDHTLLPKFLYPAVARVWWDEVRRSFSLATALTTPTRRAASFLEKNAGIDHVLAISCGLNVKDYTPKFADGDTYRIAFVGRVTGEKHLDVLLKAVKRLPTDFDKPVHVDIVGGGDQKQNLIRMAEQLGLSDRVHFHGYLSDEELRQTLTDATVFAMPSIAELQSIATMEAMASGLPVVAADAMALPHLVHDGENGYLFKPGDPDDLAQKLEKMLRLPAEERFALGKRGLEMVQMHDIERTLDLFERLYRGEDAASVALDSVNEQDHSLDEA